MNKDPEKDRMHQARKRDELNLTDYWRVVWKRKSFVAAIMIAATLAAAVSTLFITDVYRATAVIAPVNSNDSGASDLSLLARQFGGVAGLSMPSSGSASEIMSLIKSNILMEEVVKRYGLMQVLFKDRWDGKENRWKEASSIPTLNPARHVKGLAGPATSQGENGGPTMWDALRRLKEAVGAVPDIKNDTINLSVEFNDPEVAATLLTDIITTLTDHMSNESKRVAETNRKYLESQLSEVGDPIIRQKIYNLIAHQIEVAMMSEVKENFAFKVIDPPMAPDRRVWPRRTRFVLIAFAASLLAGALAAFILEYFEKTGAAKGRADNDAAEEESKGVL